MRDANAVGNIARYKRLSTERPKKSTLTISISETSGNITTVVVKSIEVEQTTTFICFSFRIRSPEPTYPAVASKIASCPYIASTLWFTISPPRSTKTPKNPSETLSNFSKENFSSCVV